MGSLTSCVNSNTQLLKKKMKYCVALLCVVLASFTPSLARKEKRPSKGRPSRYYDTIPWEASNYFLENFKEAVSNPVLDKLNKIEGNLEDLLLNKGYVIFDNYINQEFNVTIKYEKYVMGRGVIESSSQDVRIPIRPFWYRITRITASARVNGTTVFCNQFNQDPGTHDRQFNLCPIENSTAICKVCDANKEDCC